MTTPLTPIRLPANQPPQFYRGGAAIAALRRGRHVDPVTGDDGDADEPEDWVASTTTLFGRDTDGLTRLPDGRWLRDAVHADPHGWLGAEHVEAYGDSTALLVKLLDAGQRLPVHVHPTDAFARRHFGAHAGKTEAWIVVGTRGDAPTVYTGFRRSYDTRTIHEWVRDQDAQAMLEALNAVPVSPGDTVYIPAGLPHAIGEGVFVVELQQPTDFSLTLEWRGFLPTAERGHLGLGFDTALEVLDTSGWDTERLRTLIRRPDAEAAGTVDLLVAGTRPYFRAEALRPAPALALEPSFAVLITLDGEGTLRTERGAECPVGTGDTLVVPHGAGALELAGPVTVIRCRPPAPPVRSR